MPEPVALPSETEVAVIGGGIAGISTAYFLAKAGVPVTVLEKGRIAGEQSSRNWGWVRRQGRDPRELPAIITSLRIWEGLERELGADIGWRRGGVAYLGRSEEDMARFERWLELARPYGLDTRLLSAAETDALVGQNERRWRGGLYTPSDGRAEPAKAVPAMAEGARALGATIVTGCAVRAIETEAGRVSGVITERGAVRCRAVLCAAGAWSSLFNRAMGIALPQLAVRATVLRTEPAPLVSEANLWCTDVALRRRQDGGYTVARGGAVRFDLVPDALRWFRAFLPALRMNLGSMRVRVGSAFVRALATPSRWSPDEVTPFERTRVLDPAPEARDVASALAALQRHFPQLAGVRAAESWAGMIDATPDAIPVLDALGSPAGYLIATGFSGHGFGLGPGAGYLMAQLIQKGEAEVDLRPFRLSRFFDGSPIEPFTSV
jgi:glycine/D-amino acid oxidase-like deaminating enzyme